MIMITAEQKFEEELQAQGFINIAGVDEAGRGPLAGPVAAAAVIMPRGITLDGVYDSKKIAPKRRKLLAEQIKSAAVSYAVAFVGVDIIEEINILQATAQAMENAVKQLTVRADFLLVDGRVPLKTAAPYKCITKGDTLSYSIAAASILAKQARDEFMLAAHELYPQYGFDAHKGYGTAKHYAALDKYGICPLHRKSFLGKLKF